MKIDAKSEENGLKMFIDRLVRSGSERIKLVEFERGDVERHPIVTEVLRLYGED